MYLCTYGIYTYPDAPRMEYYYYYGIFTYIWVIFGVHVGTVSIT